MRDFLDGSVREITVCNAGDVSLIPGLGRSPGEENGNPLQYPRGAWQAKVHGVAKSQTWLSNIHLNLLKIKLQKLSRKI